MVVARRLDIRARRHAEVKINLAGKIFIVAMPVDKSGKRRHALRVDDPASLRRRYLSALSDRFYSFALDHDYRVLQRRPPRSIDERCVLDDQRVI
jgi:hypothetical protein